MSPIRAADPFAIPSPLSTRPHDLELIRIRHYEPREEFADLIDEWAARPRRKVPGDLEDWAALAEDCRERGLVDFAPILVMGSVRYLNIKRGYHQSATLFDFDDSGPEFAKLMQGTNNPAALTAPRHCESGKRLIDCHLETELDEPCDCEVGQATEKSMRECCAAALLDADGPVESDPQDSAAHTPSAV